MVGRSSSSPKKNSPSQGRSPKITPDDAKTKLVRQIADLKSTLSEKLVELRQLEDDLLRPRSGSTHTNKLQQCTTVASDLRQISKELRSESLKFDSLAKPLCTNQTYRCDSKDVEDVIELSDSNSSEEMSQNQKARKSVRSSSQSSNVSDNNEPAGVNKSGVEYLKGLKPVDSDDSQKSLDLGELSGYTKRASRQNSNLNGEAKNSEKVVDECSDGNEIVDRPKSASEDRQASPVELMDTLEDTLEEDRQNGVEPMEAEDIVNESDSEPVRQESDTDSQNVIGSQSSEAAGYVDRLVKKVVKNGFDTAASGASVAVDAASTSSGNDQPKVLLRKDDQLSEEKLTEFRKKYKINEFNSDDVVYESSSGSESDNEASTASCTRGAGTRAKKKDMKKNRALRSNRDASSDAELDALCRNPLTSKSGRVERGDGARAKKVGSKGKDKTIEQVELNVEHHFSDSESRDKEEEPVVDSVEKRDSSDDEPVDLPEIEEGQDKKKVKKENEKEGKVSSRRKKKETAVERMLRKDKALDGLMSTSEDSDGATGEKEKEKKGEKKKKKKAKIIDSDYSGAEMNESDENSDEVDISEFSDNSDSGKPGTSAKKRKRESDSSESNSDSSTKKRTTRKKSAAKKRRKRVRNSSSDGESGSDEDNKKTRGGRKNIRKIMKEDKLSQQTVNAEQTEKEIKERLKERQKQFNNLELFAEIEGSDAPKQNKVVLDKIKGDDGTVQDLEVDPHLANKLKKHQVEGIEFLYNITFESYEIFKKGRNVPGGILAHCMGLGKTLQVIAYLHTLMHSDAYKDEIQHVLIICPTNVILIWSHEFRKWLDSEDANEAGCPNDINVMHMTESAKTKKQRFEILDAWRRSGGVLIMGYDKYRILLNPKPSKKKNEMKYNGKFIEALRNPGPDMVICDEGHKLKNDATSIHKALIQIRTKYRICLTGTPLQNNLLEYFTMVSFVRPTLLGDRKEYMNRFGNPIKNGQLADSRAEDVQKMKRRSYILNDLLKQRVLRRDYNVLKPYLKRKTEFVVYIGTCETQQELYKYYLASVVRCTEAEDLGKRQRLLADYHQLMRIWTHPFLLIKHFEILGQKMERDRMMREDDGFIDDDDSENSDTTIELSDGDDDTGKDKDKDTEFVPRTISTRNVKVGEAELMEEYRGTPPDLKGWWEGCEKVKIDEGCEFEEALSGKISVTFDILRMCERVGDKLLIFSQSLECLDLLEAYLNRYTEDDTWYNEQHPREGTVQGTEKWGWQKGRDFLRIDGSVKSEIRKSFQDRFNRIENRRGQELDELYHFEPKPSKSEEDWEKICEEKDTKLKDLLLYELLKSDSGQYVVDYHEHDTLLQNNEDEKLSPEEKELAKEEYERAKRGLYEGSAVPNNFGAMINADMVRMQQMQFQQDIADREQISRIPADMLSNLSLDQLRAIDAKQLALLTDAQCSRMSLPQLQLVMTAKDMMKRYVQQQATIRQMQPLPRHTLQSQQAKPPFPFQGVTLLPPNPDLNSFEKLSLALKRRLSSAQSSSDAEENSMWANLITGAMDQKVHALCNRLQRENPQVYRIVIKEIAYAITSLPSNLLLYNSLNEEIAACVGDMEQASIVLMSMWNSGKLDPPNDSRVLYDAALRQKLRYIYDNADLSMDIKQIVSTVMNPILRNMNEPQLN